MKELNDSHWRIRALRSISTEKANGIIQRVRTTPKRTKREKLKQLVYCCLCKDNNINISPQVKLSFV